MLRLHVPGGFAGQLSGLAYALWIKANVRDDVEIIFHTGGITRRELAIAPILRGLDYEIVDDFSASLVRRAVGRVRRFGPRLRRSAGVTTRHGLANPVGEIHRADLRVMTSDDLDVFGYYTDWSVALEVLPEIVDRLSPELGRPLRKCVAQDPYVTVHWRLGDYVTNRKANAFHGVVPWEYIERAIDHSLGEVDLPVIITSDTPEVAVSMMSERGNNRECTVVSGPVLNDVELLCSGRIFIGTNSGLSMWVAMLRHWATPESRTLLPSRWTREAMSADAVEVAPGVVLETYRVEFP